MRIRASRPDPPRASASDALALLREVAAEPRPAGSEAEDRVRQLARERLERAGFDVREEWFGYSAFPGMWATPAGGAVAAMTLATASVLGAHGHPLPALVVLALAAALLGVAALYMARRGVLDMPLLRAEGANLVATRGRPRVWLVAHLDSKSQPVPMLLRVAGVVVTALAWIVLLVLAARAVAGADAPGAWRALGIAGVVAALPVMASVVGARSAGAVDDASGVATVLLAVSRLAPDLSVGVLLTTAEELGMAGARAFARVRAPAIAINVDGVDDRGPVICMRHGRGARARVGVTHGAASVGTHVRDTPTIPGLLTDGVALADAGWSAVTLSRGTLGTLARIHRRADDVERMRGTGVEAMARLVAAAAREIA
ncbi:MAG TPA: M28 family peptidase [Gemmatimonadaceae bacterium]|nr:M28 family peptidase [Gemmatimonadaceae bacterium]